MAIAAPRRDAELIAFPGAAPGRGAGLIAAALKTHRLPERLAGELARAITADLAADPEAALAAALAERMRPAPLDLARARGILLLGPSGVGKSLVAQKIAAAAHALGRAVLLLPAREGLSRFRAGLLPPALAVMEAEGFHPLNPRARGAFAALGQIDGLESIGVVSAAGDAEDMAEMIAAFRFHRLIATGLDRTRRLGALTAAATGARLAHLLRGPGGMLEELTPAALAAALLRPLPH